MSQHRQPQPAGQDDPYFRATGLSPAQEAQRKQIEAKQQYAATHSARQEAVVVAAGVDLRALKGIYEGESGEKRAEYEGLYRRIKTASEVIVNLQDALARDPRPEKDKNAVTKEALKRAEYDLRMAALDVRDRLGPSVYPAGQASAQAQAKAHHEAAAPTWATTSSGAPKAGVTATKNAPAVAAQPPRLPSVMLKEAVAALQASYSIGLTQLPSRDFVDARGRVLSMSMQANIDPNEVQAHNQKAIILNRIQDLLQQAKAVEDYNNDKLNPIWKKLNKHNAKINDREFSGDAGKLVLASGALGITAICTMGGAENALTNFVTGQHLSQEFIWVALSLAMLQCAKFAYDAIFQKPQKSEAQKELEGQLRQALQVQEGLLQKLKNEKMQLMAAISAAANLPKDERAALQQQVAELDKAIDACMVNIHGNQSILERDPYESANIGRAVVGAAVGMAVLMQAGLVTNVNEGLIAAAAIAIVVGAVMKYQADKAEKAEHTAPALAMK